MTGPYLNIASVLWAMDETPPDLPPQLKWTLVALARYADDDGTAAFPATQTLAYVTGKSRRQIQRDLSELLTRGLIRHGDQRLAKDIRADHRPIVYDLAMPRGDTHDTPYGVTPTTPRKRPRGDTHDRTGRHMSAQRGDTHDTRRVLKTPEQGAFSRGSAGATPHDAPGQSKSGLDICPQCAGGQHDFCHREIDIGDCDCIQHDGPEAATQEKARCASCQSGDHEHCTSYKNGQQRCYCPHPHENLITTCMKCLLGQHAQCSRDQGVTCHCPCGGTLISS